jgi:hypothetical protein
MLVESSFASKAEWSFELYKHINKTAKSITFTKSFFASRAFALPTQLDYRFILLRDEILLRLQLVAQLPHLAFVVVHVVGIVVVEAARQEYGRSTVAFHANLLLRDATEVRLCSTQLFVEEGLLPAAVR